MNTPTSMEIHRHSSRTTGRSQGTYVVYTAYKYITSAGVDRVEREFLPNVVDIIKPYVV